MAWLHSMSHSIQFKSQGLVYEQRTSCSELHNKSVLLLNNMKENSSDLMFHFHKLGTNETYNFKGPISYRVKFQCLFLIIKQV